MKADPRTPHDVTSIIGCAVMTGAGAVINTAGVKRGQSVAIFGVGGVGLSAVVGARMAGANPIIAVDLDEAKLEFAHRFGATHMVNASQGRSGRSDPRADAAQRRVHDPEDAGHPAWISRSTASASGRRWSRSCRPCRTGHFGVHAGGTAVLVGVPGTPVELNAMDMLLNEKHFIGSIGGSCQPDRDFPKFLDWHQNGDLDLDAMVTQRYRLEDINEATDALAAGKISGRAILEFEH